MLAQWMSGAAIAVRLLQLLVLMYIVALLPACVIYLAFYFHQADGSIPALLYLIIMAPLTLPNMMTFCGFTRIAKGDAEQGGQMNEAGRRKEMELAREKLQRLKLGACGSPASEDKPPRSLPRRGD